MSDNPILYNMILTIKAEARKTVEKFGERYITLEEGKSQLAVLHKVLNDGLKTAHTIEDENYIKILQATMIEIDYYGTVLQKIEYEKQDALRTIMNTIEY